LFSKLNYLKGFGNTFISEALEGAVPQSISINILDQNSPIKLKYGLYPEQLSGTAFTVKRGDNQKIWLYKLRPSAVQGKYKKSQSSFKIVGNFNDK
jgi:homogentisate 1,2-dioxygenase